MAITAVARGTVTGTKLEQGEFTKLTIHSDADIDLFEINVQPPGLDLGDPIETTTMHNTRYRTYVPRKLVGTTTVTGTVGYDPAVYDDVINVMKSDGGETAKDGFTVTFASGDQVAFYGYLKSFQPTGITFDTFPTADIEIVVTNTASDGSEDGPDFTAAV